MEPRFLLAALGLLVLAIGIFVGGFYASGIWSTIMIGAGAVGCIAWLWAAANLAGAMNSDV